MVRTRAAHTSALVLAVGLVVSACGGTKQAATSATVESAASGTVAPGGVLSGEKFLATAQSRSGTAVTLGRCSLLTTPVSDGTLPCRVIGKDGADLTDASGLPVDVFIRQSDLSADARAVVAECDTMCTVQITGTLDRASDGTGYLGMTDVVLTTVY